MAFYRIDPWGEWRADVRSALLASLVANANRDPKRKATPYRLEDFMLFEKEKKRQSVEEQKAIAKMVHAAFQKKR